MSSPEAGSNAASGEEAGELRRDELSRRMFIGGLFGLPWLWIVHTFFWHGQQRAADQALLDSNEDARQPQQEEELINMKQREWVRRGRNAAVVAMTLWCGWIVVVQLFLKDILPNALYVRSEDYAERTGW
mmetsp:Transcript_10923/g.30167  ORF Transcript_10923/g.30167 Transcript_10923/m.30167 type:complete len:130 (+) Transcript_10923:226-615(+)